MGIFLIWPGTDSSCYHKMGLITWLNDCVCTWSAICKLDVYLTRILNIKSILGVTWRKLSFLFLSNASQKTGAFRWLRCLLVILLWPDYTSDFPDYTITINYFPISTFRVLQQAYGKHCMTFSFILGIINSKMIPKSAFSRSSFHLLLSCTFIIGALRPHFLYDNNNFKCFFELLLPTLSPFPLLRNIIHQWQSSGPLLSRVR